MTNIDLSTPLFDLHRHLDGSIRLETILDLGRQHNLPLPAWEIEALRPHVQVMEPQPGVMAFLEKFNWMIGVLVDYEACRRVAYENVLDARNEGIAYVELRFSPWFMAQGHGLDPAGIVEAVAAGVDEGRRETGIGVKLIGIISRTYGPETGMKELQALLTQRDKLVGLDLAGDEANYPGAWFEEHFRIGREAGWRITAHAGEAAGPESVWQALRGLGAERVGHATRINEDPALVDYLAERGICIEANLTSNVQTSTVASLAAHPMKGWLERGLKATLNTDDPGISRINLPYEYDVAAPAAGLSVEQIRQAQKNATAGAFLTEDERKNYLNWGKQ
ncbi:MAG: adenosine deaminase [Anaerolineae bacterium]|nr:MAG: adenosine deaminase [Anaerolineae bacterium]